MAAEINSTHATDDGRRPWRYAVLLALQTAGAAVIIWNGLPIYQQIVADPSKHVPRPETLVWSAAAVVIVQSTFWLGRRLHPTLPQGGYLLVGHGVLFLSRLCFTLATSMFSVVFIMRPLPLVLPPLRAAMLLAVLFSVFCYTQELERVGRALQGIEKK